MIKETTNVHLHQSLSRLFGELDEEHINHILAVARQIEFEPGQYVFKQGEVGSAFYIVLSGLGKCR
jgi:CRP-like cAMP-binding protein